MTPKPRATSASVNPRRLLCGFLFTLLALSVVTPTAYAERVLVLRPTGDGDPGARDAVAASLGSALETLSYEAVLESQAMPGEAAAAPESANDFRAIGELLRCDWVVEPDVHFTEGGYRLLLRVGFVQRTRLETLAADVHAAREQARLVEMIRAALRYDGVGMEYGLVDGVPTLPVDAAALDAEARQAAEREANRQAEQAAAEEAARQEAERARLAEAEAARLAEEEAQRNALAGHEADHLEAERRARWEGRERYGVGERYMVSGGIGMLGVLNPHVPAYGGVIGQFEGRFGYSFPSIPGLEVRGGLDVNFGATGGFALTGGAVYLANRWPDAKVHIGGGLELGYYQALTGNRVPQLLVRGEALVNWHVARDVWLEGALPVFSVLSANGGVVTLGFAVRAGTRF